jgi:hypothetical protein
MGIDPYKHNLIGDIKISMHYKIPSKRVGLVQSGHHQHYIVEKYQNIAAN